MRVGVGGRNRTYRTDRTREKRTEQGMKGDKNRNRVDITEDERNRVEYGRKNRKREIRLYLESCGLCYV